MSRMVPAGVKVTVIVSGEEREREKRHSCETLATCRGSLVEARRRMKVRSWGKPRGVRVVVWIEMGRRDLIGWM